MSRYMVEFNFVNDKAMNIKFFNDYEEMTLWWFENNIVDGKIYELEEV